MFVYTLHVRYYSNDLCVTRTSCLRKYVMGPFLEAPYYSNSVTVMETLLLGYYVYLCVTRCVCVGMRVCYTKSMCIMGTLYVCIIGTQKCHTFNYLFKLLHLGELTCFFPISFGKLPSSNFKLTAHANNLGYITTLTSFLKE